MESNARTATTSSEPTLLRGNQAVGEGAIRAGCRFFFGYPITPQNELFEYMARRLPEVGGTFLQSESELSGIHMVSGAAAGGRRCMTSSSGPGFSLMGEGLTTLAAAELPAVVVCVSRSGPGLGRIASSQADYRLATRGGGHGDYQCLVLGPGSAQELYALTYQAFELADHYRNPVIILSDAILGQMMEPVDLDALPAVPPPEKEWSVRGKGAGPRKVIKVAPHTDAELIDWNRNLEAKYRRMTAAEQRYEALEMQGAFTARRGLRQQRPHRPGRPGAASPRRPARGAVPADLAVALSGAGPAGSAPAAESNACWWWKPTTARWSRTCVWPRGSGGGPPLRCRRRAYFPPR